MNDLNHINQSIDSYDFPCLKTITCHFISYKFDWWSFSFYGSGSGIWILWHLCVFFISN